MASGNGKRPKRPPSKTVILPALEGNLDDLRKTLRESLKHEPSAHDLVIHQLGLEADHVFGQPGHRRLRYLIYLEYCYGWIENELGVSVERPWAKKFRTLEEVLTRAIELEEIEERLRR